MKWAVRGGVLSLREPTWTSRALLIESQPKPLPERKRTYVFSVFRNSTQQRMCMRVDGPVGELQYEELKLHLSGSSCPAVCKRRQCHFCP